MSSLNFNFNLENLNKITEDFKDISHSRDICQNDIAIIGLNAKVGEAQNVDEVREVFLKGKSMIKDLPDIRLMDIKNKSQNEYLSENDFAKLAYLNRIDLFDPKVFNISPMEASFIDEAQRIFLESSWLALEDAGYCGDKIKGSNTAIYIGYSSNNVMKGYEDEDDNQALGLMVTGQNNSFMASRLSYILDLKGPTMIIDTACSSSLVAVHEAIRALRNRDIEKAIVASVRVYVKPGDGKTQMGTSSSTGYTKCFDDLADGTGGGEGVITLILKRLDDAIMDNDHIYAVLKGSAINQDGRSIGLTAPNSNSQSEVIKSAWKDAGVSADQISYIEAHGTATKLGDPIEIGAISEAFLDYTNKKQFCAIGSAKTNFGHLDCASGLLGLLKVIMMLNVKKIPSSLHFNLANKKIDYINSPIFINDKLRDWSNEDKSLIAGVSSFGLSGTNCHVIIKSYEEEKKEELNKDDLTETDEEKYYLLTASATDRNSLLNTIKSYQKYLSEKEVNFCDFCYTINTGREKFDHRFAGVFKNLYEFISLKDEEILSLKNYRDIKCENDDYIDYEGYNKEEILKDMYLRGDKIDFNSYYLKKNPKKVSAPGYSFNYMSFKNNINSIDNKKYKRKKLETKLSSTIDRCILESDDLYVFEKEITINSCMEIREHILNGVNVMPGTSYVEMAHFIGRFILKTENLLFDSITFLNLMDLKESEKRIMHAIAQKESEVLKIRFVSKKNESEPRLLHCQTEIREIKDINIPPNINISNLLSTYEKRESESFSKEKIVELGDHRKNDTDIYICKENPNSIILSSKVRDGFEDDLSDYFIIPSLLDGSVNGGNILLNETYLPLNYKNAIFFKEIKGRVYSLIERINPGLENEDIEFFNIKIIDQNGHSLARIDEYALKRFKQSDLLIEDHLKKHIHEVIWKKERNLNEIKNDLENENIREDIKIDRPAIIVTFSQNKNHEIIDEINKRHEEIILIELDEAKEMLTYDITQLVSKECVIYNLLSFGFKITNKEDIMKLLKANFYLSKALTLLNYKIKLVLIVENAFRVDGKEKNLNHSAASLIGFISSLDLELIMIDVSIFDIDRESNISLILDQIYEDNNDTIMAIRKNSIYFKYLSHTSSKNPIVIEDKDVILIPGGFGGIGLSVSEYIFKNNKNAKIILLSRTGNYQFDKNTSDKRYLKLKKLKDLGYDIRLMKADVRDFLSLKKVISDINDQLGNIDGLIFASGLGESGTLLNKTWQDQKEILETKILGIENTNRALKDSKLKYFIMFSSLSSIIGSAGQSAYIAANSFLDSYVPDREDKAQIMTINRNGRKESGMAYNFGVDFTKGNIEFVSDDEGMKLFGAALKYGHEKVAILKFKEKLNKDQYEHIKQRVRLPEEYLMDDRLEELQDEEIEIFGKSPEKITDEERNIANARCNTLKIKSINLNVKFLEVGGNSLLASYLHKEINKIYPQAISITDIFAYPSISDMASYIREKNNKTKVDDDIDNRDLEDIISQFASGNISIEEMERLI